MARKKVSLQWIANDVARRATFKKRRKGLLKKVSELTTLCDIKACVLVYGAGEQQPEVWPSAPEAMRLMSKFKALPEMEQNKKMMNHEGFLHNNIGKLQEQVRKMENDSRELTSNHLMHEYLAGHHPGGLLSIANIVDAPAMAWVLDMKMRSVQEMMRNVLQNNGFSGSQPTNFNAVGASGSQAGNFNTSGASGSQVSNFSTAVQMPLNNPFPLLFPSPGAAAVGSSSYAPAPQNLHAMGRSPMELPAPEAALNQRLGFFADYGVANNNNHGSLSSIVQNNVGTMNMTPGTSYGTAGLQQDEMLPPGFEDQQALNLSSWFDGNYNLNPNHGSDYNP